jgi:hypothetical protein
MSRAYRARTRLPRLAHFVTTLLQAETALLQALSVGGSCLRLVRTDKRWSPVQIRAPDCDSGIESASAKEDAAEAPLRLRHSLAHFASVLLAAERRASESKLTVPPFGLRRSD